MGDELEDFCRAEYPRLVGTLVLYTRDPHLAPDLAQEALARACRDWDHVSTLAAPGAWVHRVAINLANSTFRRRGVERRAGRRDRSDHDRSGPDPADVSAVRSAVAALPRRQRAAIVLRYWAQFSVDETAAAMGCASGTVKALTHQGMTRLRQAGLSHDVDDGEERDDEPARR